MSILVVDDVMTCVLTVQHILGNKDYEVVLAQNGRRALLRLPSEPGTRPVVTDIAMPEMNSMELPTIIRKNEKWRNLPPIACAGSAKDVMVRRLLEAGCSDYNVKSVNPRVLCEEVVKILGESGAIKPPDSIQSEVISINEMSRAKLGRPIKSPLNNQREWL